MFLLALFILGLAIGSFLNVLIDRLSRDKSILGRSHCDYCRKTLSWQDLIPILSYVYLRGRCRYCHRKLSMQYPIIEFLTGTVLILTWVYAPVKTDILRVLYLGLVSCLIVIFFADAKYQIIPDEIQITTFIITLGIFVVHRLSGAEFLLRFTYAILVMTPILILFLLTRGKGMGFADVKLALIIGFLLGLSSGLFVLYLSFVMGAIAGIVLIFFGRKKMKSKIAFGPFLVLGMMLMIFFEKQIYLLLSSIIGL